ncbi:glycoside hydrolase family 16 protein [Microdochium trichocladiopsis]|uniref:Glycoside hydrolase family 16 protein n=1 Tax=Microdochium trichocladiopsis TaxID=1682393 RepID=A0A9P8YJJ2_9PEZI|nr:glycoside hydrolase family 16 protein [Microdochium trichocladiopsis]KAH7041584.1 glycoside hydrolase family 16 protein [Microdochium trichocladiopsis]
MLRSLPLLGAALLGASTVLAVDAAPKCSLTQKCPESAPCCSQYGACGAGAYCLGGCDPRMSFSLDSCVPAPVCQSRTMEMTDTKRIVDVSKYLGDASKADWVAQGSPIAYNGHVLLTMPPRSVGTVLASTVYMWYGRVKARMKTGIGAGVVTAFILMSDVKDEIDYEWVGVDLTTSQTNYYYQGIPDYTHSGNITGASDTNANWHDYEINWTPDKIEWLVDGKVGRTQLKKDTWNKTANRYDYPQTPSRVQLSLWPGGADTNAQGTIDWAGGPIQWDSQQIKENGYYYASVGEITIECFGAKSPPGSNLHTSYVYKDAKATEDTVVDGDAGTIIKSLLATGLDMNADYPNSGGSASNSPTQELIPGLSGGGPGTNGQAPVNDNGGSGTSGGNPAGTDVAPQCTATGFTQNCQAAMNGNGNGGTSGASKQDVFVGASMFGAILALSVALLL